MLLKKTYSLSKKTPNFLKLKVIGPRKTGSYGNYFKLDNNTKGMVHVIYVIEEELFQVKLRQVNFKVICIKAINVLEEKELYEVCKMARDIINDTRNIKS